MTRWDERIGKSKRSRYSGYERRAQLIEGISEVAQAQEAPTQEDQDKIQIDVVRLTDLFVQGAVSALASIAVTRAMNRKS